MNFMTRLKHWQVFLLVYGIPIIAYIYFLRRMISAMDAMEYTEPFREMQALVWVMMPFLLFYMFWFLATGLALHRRLPPQVNMNRNRFVLITLISTLLNLVAIFLMTRWFLRFPEWVETAQDPAVFPVELLRIMIPVMVMQLIAMAGFVYMFIFIGKALKSVETKTEAHGDSYIGEFFLLWFWPIGIWLLQPRINRIFAANKNG